jgi:hypothetical protein
VGLGAFTACRQLGLAHLSLLIDVISGLVARTFAGRDKEPLTAQQGLPRGRVADYKI